MDEVSIQKEFRDVTKPSNIFEPLHLAYKSLEALSTIYGTEGIPDSCLWTQTGVSREEIEIFVAKRGRWSYITYGWTGTHGLAIGNFPAGYRIELRDRWTVTFGAAEGLSNQELTQQRINISSPWDVTAETYRGPWGLHLTAQPWRTGELGEVCATANPDSSQWQGNEVAFDIPLCAATAPTFIEVTRAK
jgi:hypothetical protein